ncbi:MAG TPA: FtsX-like permease family protein, partial [Polyangiaceae bacterium]|nr:FtsX-like permease family protein [Polyangiaceae bacterium]
MRWRTAWHLAIAETRRSRGMLLFCVLSVAIGVMALTAIRTVTENVTTGITGQARQVMGGDLALKGNEPLSNGHAQMLTRDLLQHGARLARNTQFYSMLVRQKPAEQTGSLQTQLVNVRAVGDGFPFYGEVETVPARQWAALGQAGSAQPPGVLVDPSVMHALALNPGDPVKLGELSAVVLGTVTKRAGSITSEFSLAPILYVHERHVAATQLIKTGSRIRYENVFALPVGMSADDWKEGRWNQAMDANLRIQTSREAASNVQRFLSRLSKFLTVVGLITLFLGALGIGSALHTFMASRLDHAAVLRCLGARSRDLFAIYLLVGLLVALSGSVIGVLVGALIPTALATGLSSLSAGLLFVDVPTGISPSAMVHGLLAGVAAALGFTLTPVWRTAAVSPLRVLGRSTGGLGAARSGAQYAGLVGVAALTLIAFVLTVSQTDSWQTGLAFTASIAAALGALFVVSRSVVLLVRRWGGRLRSFHLRQGLANLQRPGNQTGAVVVAVGMGFLLLGSILTIQASVEKLLEIE